jgi:HD-like signal output (HDOD) protein
MAESIEAIVREHLEAGKIQLPIFDEVSAKIHSMLQSSEFDIGEVESLITRDTVLASNLLRCANSPFYGGLEKIVTVREAISRLGSKQVSKLVILIAQKGNFRARSPVIQAFMPVLWKHSVAAAFGCQWLAKHCRLDHIADEAFLAGLLHDIGKLFLLRVLDELTTQQGSRFAISEALVLELLTAMHAEQGHRLLARWGIPEPLSEVVKHHHDAEIDGANPLLCVLRLVDLACAKIGLSLTPDDGMALAALPEASWLGASEIVLAELEVALEDAMALA